MAGLFTLGFLKVALLIGLIILVAGAIFWWVDKRGNETLEAEGSAARGIGHGFWWAGVTATTIGYGDLVPKTAWGRVVAMIWMLFSMALTAILTAFLVSLGGGKGRDVPLADALSQKRVAIVDDGSLPRAYLADAGGVSAYADLSAALAAFDAGEVDVLAHPYQQLKAAAGDREVKKTRNAPVPMVVRVDGSPDLRSAIDRIILTPRWQQRMSDQFGD